MLGRIRAAAEDGAKAEVAAGGRSSSVGGAAAPVGLRTEEGELYLGESGFLLRLLIDIVSGFFLFIILLLDGFAEMMNGHDIVELSSS